MKTAWTWKNWTKGEGAFFAPPRSATAKSKYQSRVNTAMRNHRIWSYLASRGPPWLLCNRHWYSSGGWDRLGFYVNSDCYVAITMYHGSPSMIYPEILSRVSLWDTIQKCRAHIAEKKRQTAQFSVVVKKNTRKKAPETRDLLTMSRHSETGSINHVPHTHALLRNVRATQAVACLRTTQRSLYTASEWKGDIVRVELSH